VVLRYIQAFDIDNAKIMLMAARSRSVIRSALPARILGTVLDELDAHQQSTALVTLCIGGGMGTGPSSKECEAVGGKA